MQNSTEINLPLPSRTVTLSTTKEKEELFRVSNTRAVSHRGKEAALRKEKSKISRGDGCGRPECSSGSSRPGTCSSSNNQGTCAVEENRVRESWMTTVGYMVLDGNTECLQPKKGAAGESEPSSLIPMVGTGT